MASKVLVAAVKLEEVRFRYSDDHLHSGQFCVIAKRGDRRKENWSTPCIEPRGKKRYSLA